MAPPVPQEHPGHPRQNAPPVPKDRAVAYMSYAGGFVLGQVAVGYPPRTKEAGTAPGNTPDPKPPSRRAPGTQGES